MTKKKRNNQIVGNIGLFYICYELSKRNWNCRIDKKKANDPNIITIYSLDRQKTLTILTKSLSGKWAVPFGNKGKVNADFVIIATNVDEEKPEVFIMKAKDVEKKLIRIVNSKGEVSYWLEKKDYENFREKWNIIGKG